MGVRPWAIARGRGSTNLVSSREMSVLLALWRSALLWAQPAISRAKQRLATSPRYRALAVVLLAACLLAASAWLLRPKPKPATPLQKLQRTLGL